MQPNENKTPINNEPKRVKRRKDVSKISFFLFT
jgi:hypothetical protein